MSETVQESLREAAEWWRAHDENGTAVVFDKAADEVDRLTATISTLQAELAGARRDRDFWKHGCEVGAAVLQQEREQHKARLSDLEAQQPAQEKAENDKFANAEYLAARCAATLARNIAHQIRDLRAARGWSQGDLAAKLGKPQSCVSRIEDPDYGKHTLQTLLEVAAAFDASLSVRLSVSPSQPGNTGDEWQPIETAPKDGTEVLGYMGPKHMGLIWYFAPSSRTSAWLNDRGVKVAPTHWMPLPSAPLPSSREGEGG